jgi:hypothetical protein
MNGNKTCLLCEKNYATQACLCKHTLTYLCDDCMGEHRKQNSGIFHLFIDLELVSETSRDSTQLKLYKLTNKLITKKVEYLTYKESLLSYIRKLQETREELVEFVNSTFESAISNLTQSVSSINSSIERLDCIAHPTPSDMLDSSYFKKFKCGIQSRIENISIDKEPVFEKIKDMIKIEYSEGSNTEEAKRVVSVLSNIGPIIQNSRKSSPVSYEYEGSLYFIPKSTKHVLKYEPITNTTDLLLIESPFQFPEYYRMCKLKTGDLFVCGGTDGGNYLKRAFVIKLNALSVEQLPDMIRARQSHSVISHEDCVYVFGGYDGSNMLDCEKFDLTKKTWSKIANLPKEMNMCYSVCLYRDTIYIPSIGFYNPQLNSYELDTSKIVGIPISYKDYIYLISNGDDTNQILLLKDGTTAIEHYPTNNNYWTYCSLSYYNGSFFFTQANSKKVFEFNSSKRSVRHVVDL